MDDLEMLARLVAALLNFGSKAIDFVRNINKK